MEPFQQGERRDGQYLAVDSCNDCPFARHARGHGFIELVNTHCAAVKHRLCVTVTPPPEWCPLPITVEKGTQR